MKSYQWFKKIIYFLLLLNLVAIGVFMTQFGFIFFKPQALIL